MDADDAKDRIFMGDLPDDEPIEGDLVLEESKFTELPAGMHVTGDMTLRDFSELTALPAQLSVDGNLYLRYLPKLTELPPGLVVGKGVVIDHCPQLARVPEELHCRMLELDHCEAIQSLPPLELDELRLQNCHGICELPEQMRLRCLDLGDSRYLVLNELPAEMGKITLKANGVAVSHEDAFGSHTAEQIVKPLPGEEPRLAGVPKGKLEDPESSATVGLEQAGPRLELDKACAKRLLWMDRLGFQGFLAESGAELIDEPDSEHRLMKLPLPSGEELDAAKPTLVERLMRLIRGIDEPILIYERRHVVGQPGRLPGLFLLRLPKSRQDCASAERAVQAV